ncbi:MAG: hypothetical protein AAFQ42_06285 [Pseudomonadota bacterium]
MTDEASKQGDAGSARKAPASREDRLAAALRDNLKRRKARAKRTDVAGSEASAGLGPDTSSS